MHAAASAAPRSRWSFLANMKVQTKILLGFASVLVILGVVGGSGLWSSMTVTDRFAEYDRLVGTANSVLAVNLDFQRLRRQIGRASCRERV